MDDTAPVPAPAPAVAAKSKDDWAAAPPMEAKPAPTRARLDDTTAESQEIQNLDLQQSARANSEQENRTQRNTQRSDDSSDSLNAQFPSSPTTARQVDKEAKAMKDSRMLAGDNHQVETSAEEPVVPQPVSPALNRARSASALFIDEDAQLAQTDEPARQENEVATAAMAKPVESKAQALNRELAESNLSSVLS